MGLSINTNIASLNAQRNLNKNTNVLNRSLQRLSSGLRINSAKDDAAGLAISSRFTAQIRSLNQSVRNANDGISMVQTAEGALDENNNILQRMRELAVQAANDSNTQSDRESIQLEIDQLINEMDRITETTTFNSKKLLDGSISAFNLQVGSQANQSINFSIGTMSSSSLGTQPGSVQSTGARTRVVDDTAAAGTQGIQENTAVTTILDGSLTIQIGSGATVNILDTEYGGDLNLGSAANTNSEAAKKIAARINAVRESGDLPEVFATATTTFRAADLVAADYGGASIPTATNRNVAQGSIANGALNINGVDIGPVSFLANDADESLINAINVKTTQTGVKASLDNGELVLTAEDGRDIMINAAADATLDTIFGGGDATSFDAGFTDLRVTGTVTVSAKDTLTFAGDAAELADSGFDTLSGGGNLQAVGTIANADVTSVATANTLIESVDSALDQVANLRAELGAVQNRLESIVSNLSNVAENVAAANSRVLDADFAVETAALTKGQILQQAGISVLSQANQLQGSVLSLLQ
jgi:flagellin